MPELPEVETVRRGLAAHLVNARVTRVETRRGDLRVPLPRALAKTLEGRMLISMTRRAKYILCHFDGPHVLIIHLGMSGRLLLHEKPPAHYQKHDHVIVQWDNGTALIYNDARRFGLMALAPEKGLEAHPLFAALGPEPLERTWGGAALYEALRSRRSPVKSVIMDQRRLVGVGNIYACEALFAAGIHPARPACKVTRKEAEKLAKAIRAVLKAAIASGGSTLRDYVRSSGEAGYFQHSFKVYGRRGKPCTTCGRPVSAMRQSGRSTFFCERCQR